MGNSSKVPVFPLPSVKSSLDGKMGSEGRRSYTDLFNTAAVRSQDGRGGNWNGADGRNFKPTTHTSSATIPSEDGGQKIPSNRPIQSTGATLNSGGMPKGITNDTPKR